jgi:hypothetical protein
MFFHASELTDKCDQTLLFLMTEFRLKNQIKEFDRVFQRQASPIVEVWGTVFDAAQSKGFDRRMAARALTFSKKDFFAANLARACFRAIQPSCTQIQLRRAGGKSSMFCIRAMWLTWIRSRIFIPS